MRLSLRTAARIAWRETRSSMTKFLFVVLAVAMGVGALSGVRGFSQSVHTMLSSETRNIMAADLTARQFSEATDEQTARLDQLKARGVDRTLITETVSMAASSVPDSVPVLVSIKAVDPAKYPYYGTVKLAPEMPLAEALKPDTVAAADDVLIRLGVKVGDSIRLGSESFRMAAVVVSEPDRLSGSLNVGLRLMLSREAFMRTGLMQIGSRAAARYLFKIGPNGPTVEQVREELTATLPGALVADSRESHPLISRGVERATTFLSLVSLIALIVGAIGVAMAMYAHLQQKMDNIAVMKSIGATSMDVIRIYTIQTLMLGLMGGVLGVLLGRAVEQAFPLLVSQIFDIKATASWHFDAVVQGITVGVLTTLLFTMPPLLAIRKVRPALILRRDMLESKLPWRQRLSEGRGAVALGALILAGLGGIAAWLAGSVQIGSYFAGGLAVSLIVLSIVAWLLLRLLQGVMRNPALRLGSLTRQGLANLYRQGNQAQSILVALGLGVMFTLSVYLIQNTVIDEIVSTAPPGAPNIFLIGVTPDQVEPLKSLISQQKGIKAPAELGPAVSAQLVRINGSIEWTTRPEIARFQRPSTVSWQDQLPRNAELIEGAWWSKSETGGVVSIDDNVSKRLNLHAGDQLDFEIAGRPVHVRAVAVHKMGALRTTPDGDFIFNRATLVGAPAVYYGGVRVDPAQSGSLQRAIYQKFPTITAVNIADVLEIAQQVIDQIALVIRFLSGFAILAGAIILAASVAGTRFRRVREVVILKTLGATRANIGRIFSIEFLALGVAAGLLGAILASAFSNVILTRLLEAEFRVDWKASAVAVVLTALLANLAGWLASFRILRQKPLEILREE
ncbi:MAG: FtsX-like permease family protein [Acidobacteriota bacterium]